MYLVFATKIIEKWCTIDIQWLSLFLLKDLTFIYVIRIIRVIYIINKENG